jgi:ryanodine receptor 2
MYVPEPLDASGVELPPELRELLERLARNNHDIWAQQRMREGWTHGPARDDAKKQHPMLIPYEQLPESEKDYDRQMAVGVLKAVLAAGYEIRSRG